MTNSLWKKCIAEFIGTFTLVFFAVGTAVMTGQLLATAIAFGLVIVAMFYSIGRISGCHINPAVSIAMYTLGKMNGKELVCYIVSQVLGAIIASLALYSIITIAGIQNIGRFGVNTLITGTYSFGSVISSFVLEIILTFVFVYVICNVASSNVAGKSGGLIIGCTLILVHLVGINLTGTSVNPARSIGPALIAPMFGGGWNGLSQLWVFIVAPMGGGVLAGLVYKLMHGEDSGEQKKIESNNSPVDGGDGEKFAPKAEIMPDVKKSTEKEKHSKIKVSDEVELKADSTSIDTPSQSTVEPSDII